MVTTAGLAGYTLNGLYYAGIIYFVVVGFSLVFGIQDFVNIAHASFLAFGAYAATSIVRIAGEAPSVPVALFLVFVVTPAVIAGVGLILDRTLFRLLYEVDHIYQLLGTFGLALAFEGIIKVIWGTSPKSLGVINPLILFGTVDVFGRQYPIYNLLVIVVFVLGIIGSIVLFEWTKLGKFAQAMAEDKEMAHALGVDTTRVRMIVVGLATALAAFGGVILVPTTSAYLGMSIEFILLAFAVVVIGGIASLRGAVVACLLIGLIRSFGIAFVPELHLAIVFLIMIGVLLIKPQGIYGGGGIVR